jgi:Divergent InlB B-repeat domain
MIRKWFGVTALVVTAVTLLSLSSCGRSQQLVSIQVQPSTETFGTSNIPVSEDAGLQVQLKAYGTYIHPPVTKDITNEVTWFSNTPQMMIVNSTGLVTVTGAECGATLVSATSNTNTSAGGISSSGAIVTGFMTGIVTCYSGSGGGSNTNALTLTFSGSGSGTVTSSPTGLSGSSPGPYVGSFTSGSTVTLTATGTGGSNFVSWVGCDSAGTTNPCTVTMTGNRTVTVTFN